MKNTLKILLTLSLISLPSVINIFPNSAFAKPASMVAEDDYLIRLQVIHEALNLSVTTAEGVTVPKISELSQLKVVVDRYIQLITKESFLKSTYANHELIQRIALDLYQLLLAGRAATSNPAGTGWSYEVDKLEINKLITRVFNTVEVDRSGKSKLQDLLHKINVSTKGLVSPGDEKFSSIKISEQNLEVLQKQIDELPLRSSSYGNLPTRTAPKPQLFTILELLRSANLSENEAKVILTLIQGADNNFYDDAISALRDPAQEFTNYYGRVDELNEFVDAFSRMEKAHVFMTGKTGVGKRSILAMLQDKLVRQEIVLGNGNIPIVLEVPVTQAASNFDPKGFQAQLDGAELLAKKLDRKVILYMSNAHIASKLARNTVRNYLNRKMTDSGVHLVWSTSSQEARSFLTDPSFSRLWARIEVPEFTVAESKELIKTAYLNQWREYYSRSGIRFQDISDEALEFAAKYFPFEQPDAGNPTGMKEFLEGAIVRKKRLMSEAGETGELSIGLQDLRSYLKDKTKLDLVPGDEEFNAIFEEKWKNFSADYLGNDALKAELKKDLFSFFSSFEHKKMFARILFGAPGGGKSYAPEKLAEHFFKKALLVINAGEFSEPHSISKLVGSPPGYAGSEEQRSILTKFISEHERGIIVVEEMDNAHENFTKFLTNMITDSSFKDGIGVDYDTSRFMIIGTSNIGQEFMLPPDSKNKMSWDQFNIRKSQLVDLIEIDGVQREVPRPEVMNRIFDDFMKAIVTGSNPNQDTSLVAQEALKQKRRYKSSYVISPSRAELENVGRSMLRRFLAKLELEFDLKVSLDEDSVLTLLDLDNFEFEKGYSYVEEQLNNKVFSILKSYQSHEGGSLTAELIIEGEDAAQIHKLRVVGEGIDDSYVVNQPMMDRLNPWASSTNMQDKIKNFPKNMNIHVKGMGSQIRETKELLKLKMLDWDTRVVITQLGTSGNGKTEFAKAIAKSLYEDKDAMFSINPKSPEELTNYFRPSSGYEGGKEETNFERWFKARKNAGGGVILLDEVLSLSGLSGKDLSNRLAVLNHFYDLLDEGKLKIGNRIEDASGFIIVVTGNSLQELFDGIDDSPEAEKLIKRVIEKTSEKDIIRYFESVGVDAAKIARLGKIFLNGPLPRDVTMAIGKKMVKSDVEALLKKAGRTVKVDVAEDLIEQIVTRVTTVKLGMRKVNRAIEDMVKKPLAGIMSDFPSATTIKVQLDAGHVRWFVDNDEVKYESVQIDDYQDQNWVKAKEVAADSTDRTPQLDDLNSVKRVVLSKEDLKVVATHEVKGHWMVDFLLSGKNNSETISLIPGDGFLGYVRPKQQLNAMTSLTSVIRKLAMLEAGHRSVFKEGIFAFGGGQTGGSTEAQMRSDDLGKVNQLLDDLMSNQIFRNFTEFEDIAEKDFFRKTIRDLGKDMADYLIDYGSSHHIADNVYAEVMTERYISAEGIEKIMDAVKLKNSKEELFLMAMIDANAKVLYRIDPLDDETFQRTRKLLKDLSLKSAAELSAISPGEEINVKALKERILSALEIAECTRYFRAG